MRKLICLLAALLLFSFPAHAAELPVLTASLGRDVQPVDYAETADGYVQTLRMDDLYGRVGGVLAVIGREPDCERRIFVMRERETSDGVPVGGWREGLA